VPLVHHHTREKPKHDRRETTVTKKKKGLRECRGENKIAQNCPLYKKKEVPNGPQVPRSVQRSFFTSHQSDPQRTS